MMKLHLAPFRLFRIFFHKLDYQPSRRKTLRVKSRNLLKCLRSDDAPQEIIVNLANISETGLQFFSFREITPGSLLKMVINFAEVERQIPAMGKVAWIRRVRRHKKIYRVGVAFLSLVSEDREFIHRFVKNVLAAV